MALHNSDEGVKFEYRYSKKECGKCGRKILVEAYKIRVERTSEFQVTCAECIDKMLPGYEKEFPDEAKDITEWAEKCPLPLTIEWKMFQLIALTGGIIRLEQRTVIGV